MGTEVKALAVYDRISDPMAAVQQLGRDIARSQMFGCSNEEQGRVFAMTCLAKRCDPLALVESYHVIEGHLSMKADAMLAGLVERGGSHRIIRRTPEAAEIEITLRDDTQRFALTWEEAKQEPFVYGKERNGKRDIKKNWATPRSRMQMLWARVVSDGVRAMCPEVVCGKYAPEEIVDFDPSRNGGTAVIDSEVSEVSEVSEETETVQTSVVEYATGEQVTDITALYVTLQVPYEAQQAALAKRGVNSLRSLTADQAAEMLATLQAKAEQLDADNQSNADPDAIAASNSDPATQPQIDQAKQLMRELAQIGDADIAQRVKAKLESQGMAKLADLSMAEIDGLCRALQLKNLEAWTAATLRGHRKN